jgi:hypothetical protein
MKSEGYKSAKKLFEIKNRILPIRVTEDEFLKFEKDEF